MRKVVVVVDTSLLLHAHRHESRSPAQQPLLHGATARARFESWVPPEYSIAQLKHDAARYWHLSAPKCQLFDPNDTPLANDALLGVLLGQQDEEPTLLTLQRAQRQISTTNSVALSCAPYRTEPPSLVVAPPKAPPITRGDPFWIREKLFELFLFYALQNMSGKSLWLTCYQFKSLLQRATSRTIKASLLLSSPKSVSPSSRSTKKASIANGSKLEFDTRVLLAFKGAVSNSSGGAGATFDEFLDALVDVAGFAFPRVSPKALAFETLVTEFVIPQFESEQYAGSASTLSWSQMNALVATPAVRTLIQRFAKPVSALAASYSTTIGGARSCRGLQFHEFAKFVHELKLKSLAVSSSELCDVFLQCCRVELSQQYSATTTLASLYFSSSLSARHSSSSSGGGHPTSSSSTTFEKHSKSSTRTGSAGGNFAIHGGSTGRDRSDALTESGGVLEVMCAKTMSVLSYLALMTAPPVARVKDQLCRADFTTLPLSTRIAQLSIKAFLQHMANHFTGKSVQLQPQQHHHRYATKSSAESALARAQFLHEFTKMHQEDAMGDYLSELSNELRTLVQREASCPPPRPQHGDDTDDNDSEPTSCNAHGKKRSSNDDDDDNDDFGFSANWSGDGDDDDSGRDSDDDSVTIEDSSASQSLASLDPQLLQALRLRELEDLTELLNDGDEIYSFLASELQRHTLLNRRIDDTDTVSQMLDMWVAAGQKYAQVVSHIDASSSHSDSSEAAETSSSFARFKASVLQRFGCSLYVLATQLLRNTTLVYAYEELFSITNARVYGVFATCWDDSRSVFTTDLAMETLSLASAKLTSACAELERLMLPHISREQDEQSSHGNDGSELLAARDSGDQGVAASNASMHAKYIECVFHRASCLAAYGDTLAHNKRCVHDYELGCLLEEELEAASGSDKGSEPHCDEQRADTASLGIYRSTSALSKSSPPGQFYREANRMLRFVAAHAHRLPSRLPVVRVHLALASTQFKLATHLPRGCVAEKKLLEDALVNLAICQKVSLSAAELDAVSERKEYISAILVLRHKFFQPEGPHSAKATLNTASTAHAGSSSPSSPRSHHSKPAPTAAPVEELISPFYRFVLAAAFKDFDVESAGVLAQPQLSQLNSACGRGNVSESVMQWLLRNFDRQGDALTEKGLLQYFCWIAEADPLAFCEILDIFTSKYTETHHASITTSRPSYISKEPKAKSLRSILFSERRQQSMSSSAKQTHQAANKTGIAECVVVLSGKMTPEACGDISKTRSPSDIRLEPEVIDVLPSSANLPDELSKFCFPDDVFLYEEPLPPKSFGIVLTDIKGERLYGSCLHFYEEKDPMEVLALIASVQRGKSASLPSWISLRDIQQQKTRWRCFVPKCLCVLSSVPLFETFRTFVAQLYRLSLAAPPANVMETFVLQLLAHIALPASNLAQTSFHLLDRACLLTGCAPAQPAFYPAEVDFTILFQSLSLENILKVYTFLLTEKKVVVCSNNCSILTPVMETLRALLHPFECQVVYIPVLPLSLLDFVSAPVPFFMGVRSDTRVDNLTNEGIVVVDLDKNDVALPPNELMPSLPDVKAKKLLQALRKVAGWACSQHSKDQYGRLRLSELTPLVSFEASDPLERDVAQLARRHDELIERWSELQTLFAGFAARMLKDVRKYCSKVSSPKDPSETIAFDRRGFLTMHPSLREFCAQLFQTQLFQRFVERSAQDGGVPATGAEPEVSWLSARSMSVIWKSEPAEETLKAPQRHVMRAPSPFKAMGGGICVGERVLSQRRVSLTTIGAFPTFNAHVFDKLLAHSSSSNTSSAVAAGASLGIATPSTSGLEHPSAGAATTKAALVFHTGDSPAAKLVSAARQRLDAV